MAVTKPRKRTASRKILLEMTDEQYYKVGPELEKLKAAGAPSNTIAFLESVALASSMIPNSTEEGSPS